MTTYRDPAGFTITYSGHGRPSGEFVAPMGEYDPVEAELELAETLAERARRFNAARDRIAAEGERALQRLGLTRQQMAAIALLAATGSTT